MAEAVEGGAEWEDVRSLGVHPARILLPLSLFSNSSQLLLKSDCALPKVTDCMLCKAIVLQAAPLPWKIPLYKHDMTPLCLQAQTLHFIGHINSTISLAPPTVNKLINNPKMLKKALVYKFITLTEAIWSRNYIKVIQENYEKILRTYEKHHSGETPSPGPHNEEIT